MLTRSITLSQSQVKCPQKKISGFRIQDTQEKMMSRISLDELSNTNLTFLEIETIQCGSQNEPDPNSPFEFQPTSSI